MIKLILPQPPDFLSDELVKQLTENFESNPQIAVWKQPALKDALLAASFGKCAFSEIRLDEEGKYMQVEHFYPKSKYPEKVLEWGNLLPCSNLCNIKKRDLDPGKYPLVNPFFDNPKDYFYIENGRIFPFENNNQKSINTINAYDLNNPNQLRAPRYRWQLLIAERLREICEILDLNFKLCKNRLKSLMKDCGRTSEYSAAKSTAILIDGNYRKLKESLCEKGEWDNQLQMLEKELLFCSLPKHH